MVCGSDVSPQEKRHVDGIIIESQHLGGGWVDLLLTLMGGFNHMDEIVRVFYLEGKNMDRGIEVGMSVLGHLTLSQNTRVYHCHSCFLTL